MMITKADIDLAFCAATAYAQSPSVNKSDPAAFGKAVRQVYDAALDEYVSSCNKRLVPNNDYFRNMADSIVNISDRLPSDSKTLAAAPGQFKNAAPPLKTTAESYAEIFGKTFNYARVDGGTIAGYVSAECAANVRRGLVANTVMIKVVANAIGYPDTFVLINETTLNSLLNLLKVNSLCQPQKL